MTKDDPIFKRRNMVCSSRDSYGRHRLAVFTENGYFNGDKGRFERQRDENLADWKLAKRPPWKTQASLAKDDEDDDSE